MRKVFKLQDLDCANCAAKMERAIAKLEGVEEVSVNFISQRMTIVAEVGAVRGDHGRSRQGL